jgi:hypothetical protein
VRLLALLASVGSVLVSFWLLSVVTAILPRQNADQIPFWSAVMVAFFIYGAASWYAIQHAGAPRLLRPALIAASALAVLAGIAVIVDNEIRAIRTGDYEAYLSLMGIALCGHGSLLLAYLLRHPKSVAGHPTS